MHDEDFSLSIVVRSPENVSNDEETTCFACPFHMFHFLLICHTFGLTTCRQLEDDVMQLLALHLMVGEGWRNKEEVKETA